MAGARHRIACDYEVVETVYGEFVVVYESAHAGDDLGTWSFVGPDLRLCRLDGSSVLFKAPPTSLRAACELAVATIKIRTDGNYDMHIVDRLSPIAYCPYSDWVGPTMTWFVRRLSDRHPLCWQPLITAWLRDGFPFGIWSVSSAQDGEWTASDCQVPRQPFVVPSGERFRPLSPLIFLADSVLAAAPV